MPKNTIRGTILSLLLIGMFTLTFNIQPAGAQGTIYIRADGSIDPPTESISTVDSIVYTVNDNINDTYIVVEKNDIIIDGRGYMLRGHGSGWAIELYAYNVTIRNAEIRDFMGGVVTYGGHARIIGNIIANNSAGVGFGNSDFSNVEANVIFNNSFGLYVLEASYNTISNNIIENNSYTGIYIWDFTGYSYGNAIYHNDFIDNYHQALNDTICWNDWDAGYPSGGNYWSDYTGIDEKSGPNQDQLGSDGIGDTPYVANASDRYPLNKTHNVALKAAQLAKAVIGTPYLMKSGDLRTKGWDSKFLDVGKTPYFDCAGLVYWTYNKAYGSEKFCSAIQINKTHVKALNSVVFQGADGQWNNNVKEVEREYLQPGDLLFFDAYAKSRKGIYGKPYGQDGHTDHVAMFVGPFTHGGKRCDVVEARGGKGVVATTVDDIIKRIADLAGEESFVGFGRVEFPVFLSVKAAGQHGIEIIKLKPKPGQQQLTSLTVPVDLVVSDPDGNVITKNVSAVSDMIYFEFLDDYDVPNHVIMGLEQKEGDYFMSVIPTPEANLTDTYTLEFSSVNTTAVLAENVSISEIPSQPYIVTSNETTIIPRLDPRDIGITRLDIFKTFVGQNFPLNISVTVFNYGLYAENFNATLYVNSTIAAMFENVTLTNRDSTVINFAWNTCSFVKGNYTIGVYVSPVENETYTDDNTLSGGLVLVTIPGDGNGDLIVDIYDAIILSNAYNSNPASSNWNADVDINEDGIVDIYDAIILANHYGQHYP